MPVSIVALCATLLSCDVRPQEVRIVAQEYLFTPSLVRVQSGQPFRLSIDNRGRETHEFTSRLLRDPNVDLAWESRDPRPADGFIRLEPGRTVTLTVLAPAGTYVYWCKIRGHAGMKGTIIVE